MTQTKNNIPIYAEEQIINQKAVNIQEILNQFKQPIPSNYINLKVDEGNYQFSTSSKWKDKPNYERYGFYLEDNEEEWVQIDIPHELMEILEITQGEDITHPLYLAPDTYKKATCRGAITIENEKEIFIDKPVSEKGAERELVKRLKELEKERGENRELQEINKNFRLLSLFRKKNINKLSHRLFKTEGKIYNLEQELKKWTAQFGIQTPQQVQKKIDNIQKESERVKWELDKEKGWWDKWEKLNNEDFCFSFDYNNVLASLTLNDKKDGSLLFALLPSDFSNKSGYIKEAFFLNEDKKECEYEIFRKHIKNIYDYYKNK